MAILGRQQILDVQDLQTVDVDVPEWGGTVRLRMMSGTEREEMDAFFRTPPEERVAGSRVMLVALCAVDESGGRLFSVADLQPLSTKSGSALDLLSTAAMKMNKLGSYAEGEAEKNSDPGQTA
ncbi:MAG: hypothetical protein H7839_04785 [Magnetococcus sp. YQC-5]